MLSSNTLVRNALNKYMYKGKAQIYNIVEQVAEGITSTSWEKVASDLACHLSFKSAENSKQSETIAINEKQATLFLNSDVEVTKGSKIEIEQHGANYTFYATGEPSIYPTHQEIGLIKDTKV